MKNDRDTLSTIVVSDAGPLIAFLDAGAADTLLAPFESILIPEAVHREVFVNRPRVKPKKVKIKSLDGPEALRRYAELIQRLDPGEAEALALAEFLGLPLLIDERAGGLIAVEIGVEHFTSVDLLSRNIAMGNLSTKSAQRIITLMRQNGAYLPAITFHV